MPILIILLLAVIIAQVGFWDTLGGILGAVGMIILLVLLIAAVALLIGYSSYRRIRRR